MGICTEILREICFRDMLTQMFWVILIFLQSARWKFLWKWFGNMKKSVFIVWFSILNSYFKWNPYRICVGLPLPGLLPLLNRSGSAFETAVPQWNWQIPSNLRKYMGDLSCHYNNNNKICCILYWNILLPPLQHSNF